MMAMLTDIQLQGAYPDLQQLLGLYRHGQQLRLSRAGPARSRQAGERSTRIRGRGMDFEEARLYQPGDDIRNIDWRVTARSQQPHTKVFREERERPVMLLADLRSTLFFGTRQCFKSVLCCALMSVLGWSALANRDRVGGMIWGDQQHTEIRPKLGKHPLLEYIRQLQQFAQALTTPCPEQTPRPLSAALEQLRRLCRPGTTVVVASDFHDFDEACYQHLFQLARHNQVQLVLLSDPLEQQLPLASGLWVSNGRSRRQLTAGDRINPSGAALARLYQCADSLSLPLLNLSTADELWPSLLQHFGAPGRSRRRA